MPEPAPDATPVVSVCPHCGRSSAEPVVPVDDQSFRTDATESELPKAPDTKPAPEDESY